MDDKVLVEYYRRKLLERYAVCVNRDSRQKIAELLRSADEETLTDIIRYIESKK